MTAAELAARFQGVRQTNAGGYLAHCPAHKDSHASLSIAPGDNGGLLVLCRARCRTRDVLAKVGLTMRDLMPDRQPTNSPPTNGPARRPAQVLATAEAAVEALGLGPHAARWEYTNAGGEPIGFVVRWNRPDGSKEIIRPVSRCPGGWKIGAMPTPRPLYRLPELANAPRVIVVEGEKCADALAALGYVATTSASGAAAAKFTSWAPLASKQVFIFPDHDTAGHKYARDVARLARAAGAASVRIVELPNLAPGGDVANHIDSRHADGLDDAAIRDELETRIAAAPAAEPVEPDKRGNNDAVTVRVADVQPEPVRWLWPDRIALGKLTLLAGDPGLGKSFCTLDIAARLTTGCGWPDAPVSTFEPGGVVLLSAEDDIGDTIRPRLDAAGADATKVFALKAVRCPDPDGGQREEPFNLSRDIDALEGAIASTPGCRLVVIDPVSAYLGGGPRFDSHRNTDVRAVLAPLADLAARRGVAVVAVTHLRKSDGPALYRAMGSLAFVAAARTVWAIAKDRDNVNGPRRLMLPVKNNLAADAGGLAFELRPKGATAVLAWEPDPIATTADDALRDPGAPRGRPDDERAAAADWLRGALADGPRPVAELVEEARGAEDISKRTLERARKGIAVSFRPAPLGPWLWRLAADHATTPEPTTPEPQGGELWLSGGLGRKGQKGGFSGGFSGPRTTTPECHISGDGPPAAAPDPAPPDLAHAAQPADLAEPARPEPGQPPADPPADGPPDAPLDLDSDGPDEWSAA